MSQYAYEKVFDIPGEVPVKLVAVVVPGIKNPPDFGRSLIVLSDAAAQSLFGTRDEQGLGVSMIPDPEKEQASFAALQKISEKLESNGYSVSLNQAPSSLGIEFRLLVIAGDQIEQSLPPTVAFLRKVTSEIAEALGVQPSEPGQGPVL